MDEKLKRYYQYIMNDLLKNTIMEYDDYHFIPFWDKTRDYYIYGMSYHNGESKSISLYPDAKEHLISKFGIREEDIKYLWEWYVWHVHSTITGNYE